MDIGYVANDQCGYPADPYIMCAGDPGLDSCSGDSGGPLVERTANGWIQVGVVSFGVNCSVPGTYGQYARTSQSDIYSFISRVAAENPPPVIPA